MIEYVRNYYIMLLRFTSPAALHLFTPSNENEYNKNKILEYLIGVDNANNVLL